MLEREAGVRLLERAGRGVRLTDPALVLVEHAEALLGRAALAEADLAAAAGTVAGRGRIATVPVGALRIAMPAMEALERDAPRLRCELVEAEPEQALPALGAGRRRPRARRRVAAPAVAAARGPGAPRAAPRPGPARPARRPSRGARHRTRCRWPSSPRAPWTTGHAGMGWEEMTQRTCRDLGGFDPDIRHRTNDATISLALVARGLAVTLLPELAIAARRPGVALRRIAGGAVERAIFAATRSADAARPSTRALLDQLRAQRPEHGEREHDATAARRTAARPAATSANASASTANQSACSRCGSRRAGTTATILCRAPDAIDLANSAQEARRLTQLATLG